MKGWVFVFGLFIPIVLFLRVSGLSKEKLFAGRVIFLNPPNFSEFLGICFLGIFLRFYNLTGFHLWPTGDEGLHGFLALDLLRNWHWQFFYTVGEHPPLLIWCLSLFFKLFDSPSFVLWVLPAFFSALVIPVGFIVVRKNFPASFSMIFGCLLTFSFWPLYFGRFCHQGLFIPFWELLSLLFFVFWVKTSSPAAKHKWLIALGFWTGLGSLTFTAWAAVILLLTVMVVCVAIHQKNPLKTISFYGMALGASLLPFGIAICVEGYGHHLLDSSAASQWISGGNRWLTPFSYITALFWGSFQSGTSYGPSWGGILNPLLSSCFFLGVFEIYEHRNDWVARWIGFAFVVCLLPGLLAGDYVELNRIIQVMPFLLLISAIGLQKLFRNVKGDRFRNIGFWGLIFFSFLLDLNHLLTPVLAGSGSHIGFKKETPDENFRAYQVLDSVYHLRGAGLIFTDFLPLKYGHTLFVMTYPINAAVNVKLNPAKASWAAILTNMDSVPFFSNKFPNIKWSYLGDGEPIQENGRVVGIIDLDSENKALLAKWVQVHSFFHLMNIDAERSFNGENYYRHAQSRFLSGFPLVKDDRILEEFYWEWGSQYYYDRQNNGNIATLKKAIERGYPAAHLYSQMGDLLLEQGKKEEADKAYEMASTQMKKNVKWGKFRELQGQWLKK